MSRMKSFWNASSLNALPWPVPDGIVRRSMKRITAFARARPFGVRLTGEESSKLALRVVAVDAGRDAASRGRRQAELGRVAHHVGGMLAHDRDQRVDDGVAVLALEQHAVHDRVAALHALQRLGRHLPLTE